MMIFIIGTGRCGSSLIHEIISRHNNAGFISNIDDRLTFLNLHGTLNNFLFRTSIGRLTRKGGIRFAPSEAYRLISDKVSHIYEYSCRDLVADDVSPWLMNRFQKFFLDRITAQRKKVFLHKYTGWSRIGFFNRIFPDAKFVHIVRDGRAVANSFLQMPWWNGYQGPECWLYGNLSAQYYSEWMASGKSFVTLAAITWKMLVESFEKSKVCLDVSQYLEIRYEDFLENPREVLQRMLEFCNLDWSRSFEKHYIRQMISSARRESFRRDLSEAQNIEIEKCLSRYLLRYGYPLSYAPT